MDCTLLLLLLAFLPAYYVSAFLHELGHALCAWLVGFSVGSFGLGTARPFWVADFRGVRVYLCLRQAFQGISFVTFSQLVPDRWRMVCVLSGGVLAHLLLTALGLLLFAVLPWGQPFALLLAVLNAFLALVNLIPLTVRVGHSSLRSDGAKILQTLFGGWSSAPAPQALAMLFQFRGLWQATGDLRTLRGYLLNAAVAWLNLGNPGRAEELIFEAQALPVDSGPAFAVYMTGLLGLTLAEAGRLDEAATALEQAEKGFAQLSHPAGLFLIQWWRGELFLHQGQAPRAVQVLDALTSPPLAQWRTFRHALLVARIEARAALPDGNDLEEILAEYEALPARQRQATYELKVYRAVARCWLRRGDEARALPAYREAIEAVRALDQALVDPADRERFRHCHAPLVAEVQACLRQAGRDSAAEKLDRLFAPAEVISQEDPRGRGRTRSAWVAGLNLLFINLVWALAALWLALLFNDMHIPAPGAGHPPDPGAVIRAQVLGLEGTLSGALTLYSVLLAGLYAAAATGLGSRCPFLRRHLARALLWIGMAPWLLGALILALLGKFPGG